MMKHIFATFICCLLFLPLRSQTEDTGSAIAKLAEQARAAAAEDEPVISDSIEVLRVALMSQQLRKEIAVKRYEELQYSSYYTSSLRHRAKTFEWQFYSTILIFVLVVLVVGAGIVFSAKQFNAVIKQIKAKEKLIEKAKALGENATAAFEGLKSDLDISATGVKVSSPVLGLLILALSLGFFYMYLVHVYPISIVNIDRVPVK